MYVYVHEILSLTGTEYRRTGGLCCSGLGPPPPATHVSWFPAVSSRCYHATYSQIGKLKSYCFKIRNKIPNSYRYSLVLLQITKARIQLEPLWLRPRSWLNQYHRHRQRPVFFATAPFFFSLWIYARGTTTSLYGKSVGRGKRAQIDSEQDNKRRMENGNRHFHKSSNVAGTD